MRLQRTKAIEEPGVIAGFSHVTGLPKLLGGLVIRNKGYAYAPLVRRMDNDRLYRAIRESCEFSDVWPWGSGPQGRQSSVYKVTPWTHLNCYKMLCMIP